MTDKFIVAYEVQDMVAPILPACKTLQEALTIVIKWRETCPDRQWEIARLVVAADGTIPFNPRHAIIAQSKHMHCTDREWLRTGIPQ